MLGSIRRDGHALVFEPRFPWVAGLLYTACIDGRQLTFGLPATTATAPRVAAIWPEGETVPANLLRLYVHFSEPMQTHGVAAKVRLLDAEGSEIAEPFVEIPDGLWDAAATRLTLIVHPGRIKRGVGPHEALGPVLRAGESVGLEVDPTLESQRGVALGEAHVRALAVGAADRRSPEPDRWRVLPPPSPHEALRVDFDERLDRAQLVSAVTVLRGGRAISGRPTIEAGGAQWIFTPDSPWLAGTYTLRIRRSIEDLAGNTVDRLFDLDTFETEDATADVAAITLPFALDFSEVLAID